MYVLNERGVREFSATIEAHSNEHMLDAEAFFEDAEIEFGECIEADCSPILEIEGRYTDNGQPFNIDLLPEWFNEQ